MHSEKWLLLVPNVALPEEASAFLVSVCRIRFHNCECSCVYSSPGVENQYRADRLASELKILCSVSLDLVEINRTLNSAPCKGDHAAG